MTTLEPRRPTLNRHQRRAQYAVPSRSKPYCRPRRPRWKAQQTLKGRLLLEDFWTKQFKRMEREALAFRLRDVKPTRIGMAVRNALNNMINRRK